MKIVFFGTSRFSAGILAKLLELNHEVVAVVTRPNRPKGRSLKLQGSPVAQFVESKSLKMPLLKPEKASTEEFASRLQEFSADLFLVVAYGEILKENILSLPAQACINIHTSLLPKYRGASPVQSALLHGDAISGVTFMEMVLKMDAGDILKQVEVEIPSSMNAQGLEEALLEASNEALPDLLKNFSAYYQNKQPQDEALVSFVKKIKSENCSIDWSRSAFDLHNQVRALSPTPGVFLQMKMGSKVKRVKILSSSFEEGVGKSPGTLLVEKKSLKISCGSGWLSLLQVQVEGKKAMTIQEFLCGAPKELSLSC